MKRCPICSRPYFDPELNFCLEDGSRLDQARDVIDNPTVLFGGAVPPPGFSAVYGSDPNAATVSPSSSQPNSIAVLPFAHLSSDPDDEYFCDGLAEELINALSRVDDLKVVARSSSFFFKGKNIDIAAVGTALGVSNVVEGSVRKFGDRMRINVSLTTTADRFNVWSEKFDTEIRDIFDVQDEIARSVVNSLKTKLLGNTPANDDTRMAALIQDLQHYAHNVEAYQVYLRGRFYFNKFNEADLYRALECFEKALELEPEFAEAYSGMADVYMWLTELGPIAPLEGMPKAKTAALKAIELDPQLSEAHTSLGIVLQAFDYDFARAEPAYKQALELNPNNSLAHQMYGSLLAQVDRFDEAEPHFKRALALDPLSPTGSWIYPFSLFLAGRYHDSITRAKHLLELDQNFAAAYLVTSFANHMLGDYDESSENYCRFLELVGQSSIAVGARQEAAAGGWEGFLKSMTSDSIRQSVTNYISGVFYAALGDVDRSLDCLEASYAAREGHVNMLKMDPRFRGEIRENPRFERLLDEIGFPDNVR